MGNIKNSQFAIRNSQLSLSVYMITFNNARTIEKALQSVAGWVNDVVVVDSHSTDGTAEIARKHTNSLYQYDTADMREKY
ncbi:MAG: glycosyltransferase, partial [Deltaproteobacteria bacterium]